MRVTPKMKCFLTGCDSMNKHMKKHVIGKHPPTEAYSKTGDLPLGSHMQILEDLLNKITHHLGCEDLKALLQVLSLKFYPTTDKTYEGTEHDIELMNQFHHWLYSENLSRTPTISPPNIVASLVQWIALAPINCIGESKFNVKRVTIDKVRVTRDIVPASIDNSDVQVELASEKNATVVKLGPAVPLQVKKIKTSPLGIPYPKEEWELRLVRLVRNSQRICLWILTSTLIMFSSKVEWRI